MAEEKYQIAGGPHNSQTNCGLLLAVTRIPLRPAIVACPLGRYPPLESVGSRNWRFNAAVSSHKQRVPREAHLCGVV